MPAKTMMRRHMPTAETTLLPAIGHFSDTSRALPPVLQLRFAPRAAILAA